jgi:hypothetical protein
LYSNVASNTKIIPYSFIPRSALFSNSSLHVLCSITKHVPHSRIVQNASDSISITGRLPKKLKSSIFDFKTMALTADNLPLPTLREENPPCFIAPEGWMDALCGTVWLNTETADSENPRVVPVALTRLSRGGKTRALYELALVFKEQHPRCAIVSVSFNSQTPLRPWEKDDPLPALCRRIAFAAMFGRSESKLGVDFLFGKFIDSYEVSPQSVVDWLGSEPCLLMIDELNKVTMDTATALFLKHHFLVRASRGFVFSSHVVSLNKLLSDYMDSESNREIRTYKLPNIVTLSDTRLKLKASALTAQTALYYGLIPALIHTSLSATLPHNRRSSIVEGWLLSPAFDVNTATKLLGTILSGDIGSVPDCLLELMDVDTDEDGRNYIRWVPYHMQYVLQQMSTNALLSDALRKCLSALANLLVAFRTAKTESGDAWEALFLIVLLSQCLCGIQECDLLPCTGFAASRLVQYNAPYHGDTFASRKVDDFISGIPVSHDEPDLPAISVYYPGHAKFEVYDVIVAAWDSRGQRQLYGYQCKEGSSIPKVFANGNMFAKSFLIRGEAASKDASVRRYFTPSESHLDSFFGSSSSQWTPKAWKTLTMT